MNTETYAPSTVRPIPSGGHTPPSHKGERSLPAASPVVFVVDADHRQREALRSLAEAEGWRVEAYASAVSFLARSQPAGPACVVLDVEMPEIDGLELQRQLAAHGELPVIFNTACRDVATSVQAMKAGALDFFVKPAAGDELIASIRTGLERSRMVLKETSELDVLRARLASLTRREREVMALVVSGLLNKQVAGELGISEITVKAHRGQVMRKMSAYSLPDLVTMATRLGVRALTTH